MTEVVLSTDELTVIGGPEQIQLSLDFGSQGPRGSYIFAGNGNPNDVTIGQEVKINDLYINILSTSEEYSYLYQYQATPSGNNWNPLIKVSPTFYPFNQTGTFETVSGVGQKLFNIPIVNIVDLATSATLTSANFNVQHSINNINPVSSSISIASLTTVDDVYVLPITVKSLEYSGGTWVPLNGLKTVHFLISIVV
jgi:hypothetical protein